LDLKQKSGATEIRSGNSSAIVVEIIQNLPRIVADSAATMKAYIQTVGSAAPMKAYSQN
jgi:hypothetical protein